MGKNISQVVQEAIAANETQDHQTLDKLLRELSRLLEMQCVGFTLLRSEKDVDAVLAEALRHFKATAAPPPPDFSGHCFEIEIASYEDVAVRRSEVVAWLAKRGLTSSRDYYRKGHLVYHL